MKVEVIILIWDGFKIPEVVMNQWTNQTTPYKITIVEVKPPIYKNLSLLRVLEKSKADVVLLTDGDMLFPLNTIATIKAGVKDEECIYFINRVLLCPKTSRKLISYEININSIKPKGKKNASNEAYKGIRDKDRKVDHYPGTPGAWGYCQIGFRAWLLYIMPKHPIEGYTGYDDMMVQAGTLKQFLDLDCYHLNREVLGLPQIDEAINK